MPDRPDHATRPPPPPPACRYAAAVDGFHTTRAGTDELAAALAAEDWGTTMTDAELFAALTDGGICEAAMALHAANRRLSDQLERLVRLTVGRAQSIDRAAEAAARSGPVN